MVKISNVVQETPNIKTLMFHHEFEESVVPGQFIMAWFPGVDEIPLAISYIPGTKPSEYGITIAKVGVTTGEFHSLDKGDMFGVRGPYGVGFSIERRKRLLAVGGGIGMASIAPAAEAARKAGNKVRAAIGARTKDELLFVDRLNTLDIKTDVATDDGSAGERGFVTELAEKLLDDGKYDLVLGCGPEQMLVRLVEYCNKNKIAVQVSLERYMKCGIGICDSCAIDGFHVCKDGPVFEGELLAKFEEFGKYRRDRTGRKVEI